MNQKYFFKPLFKQSYILALICFAIIYSQSSCKLFSHTPIDGPTPYPLTTDKAEFSWNVLFQPGTSPADEQSYINTLADYIKKYFDSLNTVNGTDLKPKFFPFWCPCDSSLFNLGFTPVNGVGQSVTTPPPTKPGPAGSGDLINVVAISDNIPMGDTLKGFNVLQQYGKDSVVIRNIGTDSQKKLAIIDSGIDSSLFSVSTRNLIWSDPQKPTIYNFLPGQNINDKFDETLEKHGSAVAAIAIKAMDNAPQYPNLMILKALDKNNKGSIFSVSCALSYTIQKKATLVNLSLGYYGDDDSILKHYLGLCATSNSPIEVFVAAGNTSLPHGNLCNDGDGGNLLAISPVGGVSRLFYPACFTGDFNNITSVTQIRTKDSACFYQNYSNQFISLGLYDTLNCCSMQVGFLPNQNTNFYEGSSFATPAASGLRMSTILQSPDLSAANILWNGLIQLDASKRITIGGKYIEYASHR